MREIKFRAWDTKSELMEYEIAIGKGYGEDSYILFLGLGETFIIDEDIIKIMQYTSVKDINNLGIYEGDIIEITTESGKWITKVGNHGVWHEILVNDLDIDLEYISINYAYDFLDCEIKIIGNIYENPDLLKG